MKLKTPEADDKSEIAGRMYEVCDLRMAIEGGHLKSLDDVLAWAKEAESGLQALMELPVWVITESACVDIKASIAHNQSTPQVAALAPETHSFAVYAEGEPVKSTGNAKVFRFNPNDSETFGSVNPGIEALKKLEARQVAMLDQPELELLREFMDHGRRQGVLVEFDTDVQGWAEMNSLRALEVLALANSYVRLRFS